MEITDKAVKKTCLLSIVCPTVDRRQGRMHRLKGIEMQQYWPWSTLFTGSLAWG
jgi:hypothetical protein